ncbi:MAG: tetratricopeptide repeat protein [Planctomycetota bacterium]|nr:tetratricopeptide repeat protein [Planctomycetota bacterium]
MRALVITTSIVLFHVTTACGQTVSEDQELVAYARSFDLEATGKFDEAIAAVLQTRQADVTYHVRLGWLNYLKKDFAASESFYRQAISQAPDSIQPKIGLTLPLIEQKKYADVQSLTMQIIRKNPTNYYANLRLAFVLRMQGHAEKAEMVNDYMLALHPADVKFRLERGLTYIALSRYSEAERDFRLSLRLEPKNATATYWVNQMADTRIVP